MTNAPYYSEIASGPGGGQAFWLQTDDDVRIRVGQWVPEAARGTILFFAGRNECVEKYGTTAGEVVARGFAAVSIDWRGQGLADRLIADHRLGHVEDFADYQRDVQAILTHIKGHGLPEPYFLVGHSMGGAIGLEALYRGLPVAAAAFTAPMWGIDMKLPVRAFAWSYSALLMTVGAGHHKATGQSPNPYILETTLEENGLTGDPEMFEHIRKQTQAHPELAIGSPTIQWVGNALRETRRLASLPSPDYDCVTFLGTQESTVDPARIHDRMSRWPNGKLVMLEGARHEVMVEKAEHRKTIFDTLDAHFSAHL